MAIKYAEDETDKYKEITTLLKVWKKEVSTSVATAESSGESLFVEDGFFPNYYNQKYKVLFIGREERGDGAFSEGRKFKIVHDWLNIFNNDNGLDTRYGLLGPLLILLYSIENRFQEKYKNLKIKEKVTSIARSIGKPDGLSFAFMELSKYYNQNGAKSNKSLMEKFLEHSHLEKRNFFKEELTILNPDIIITLNLWGLNRKISEYIDKFVFGELNFVPQRNFGKEICLNCIMLAGKKIPIIDMYHFSKPGSKEKDLFNPLMRVLRSDYFNINFPKLKFKKN